MKLQSDWVNFDVQGERVSGYATRPAGAGAERLPGVVVIQEIWGVDEHIRDIAERLAAAGYLALAVDLFSHGGRPSELEPERIVQAKGFLDSIPQTAWMDVDQREAALAQLQAEQAAQIRQTLASLLGGERPMDRYLADVQGAMHWLVQQPQCDGQVASIGFCMGGGLSGLLASVEPELACAVIFYGASPPAERVASISSPILGIYGAEDARVNAGVGAFAEQMAAAGKSLEVVAYTGAGHAFFNDSRSVYCPAAARGAWARTLAFLDRNTSPADSSSLT